MSDRLRISHKMAELSFSDFRSREYRKTATVFAIQLENDIEIETREGWLKANKGDYLVTNTRDRAYPWPVKQEIFESTYAEIIPQKPEAKQ